MLKIRKDLCLGCGFCIGNCPLRAISLLWDCAEIDQGRCNQCSLCLEVCPQGAIVEMVPVSTGELQAAVTGLKGRTDDIIARIEKLKELQRQG